MLSSKRIVLKVHCLTYAIDSAKISKAKEEENSAKEVGLTA